MPAKTKKGEITSFLDPELKVRLLATERLLVGRYVPPRSFALEVPLGGATQEEEFIILLHASPLVALVEAAGMGARVYEFMSITRPGDLLHYLWITPGAISKAVGEWVNQRHAIYFDSVRAQPRPRPSQQGLPFPEFDRDFRFDGDDTESMAKAWIEYRSGAAFREKLLQLLDMVEHLQQRLRDRDDFLLRYELDLMESSSHRRAFEPDIERLVESSNAFKDKTTLRDDLYQLICELIPRVDVQSVSCPFNDYALWRTLVTEQIQRSIRTGSPPQHAFSLSGPDRGLPKIPYLDWGGAVHIPFEGLCGGDLLIRPDFLKLDAARGQGPEGRLSRVAGGKPCHYLLTDRDLGALDCADRTLFGKWVLYRSKQAYVPCDPLGVRQAFNSTRYH